MTTTRGSAAEISAWSGAAVALGAADAAFVRGERPGPLPDFTGAERELHAVVAAGLLSAPPSQVDEELVDRTMLELDRGAVVLSVPGHTPGSIALYWPEVGLLIAGDTIAEHQGALILGPFNTDRASAWQSLQRLAALDVDVACFGHGTPVIGAAAAALRRATDVFA